MQNPGAQEYTWEDFIALEEDDLRELIDGELVEVEVPTRVHERIVTRLGQFLWIWVDAGHGGEVLASGYKVRISKKRGVMPDVQYFAKDNPISDEHEQGLAKGHPTLVVEVMSRSSTRYDRVIKLEYYASIGVPEYWIVDPNRRSVERLVLDNGEYIVAQTAADEEVFAPQSFPGLAIPLAKLWT